MKAIVHINDPERWGIAARNIRHLLDYCQEQQTPCQIELAANGPAVRQLKQEDAQKSGLTACLTHLMEQGVVICACGDSMELQHISAAELLEGVQVVPLGAAEMVLRQGEGYAYLKP